jgi:AcrR family transcriptional regulator
VVSVEQVTEAGCRYFLEHGTIDMDELAVSLAVSRATLYRVINSRDRLLGAVLWELAERTMARARRRHTGDGIEGVLDVVRTFSDGLLDSKPFRQFLATEPEAATRVLFTPAGGVHRRAVKLVKELFEERTPADGPWIVGDRDNLAYLVVRIVESLYFAELLAGMPPDRDLAERTTRALILQSCAPPSFAPQSRAMKTIDAASALIWTSLPALLCDGGLTLAAFNSM